MQRARVSSDCVPPFIHTDALYIDVEFLFPTTQSKRLTGMRARSPPSLQVAAVAGVHHAGRGGVRADGQGVPRGRVHVGGGVVCGVRHRRRVHQIHRRHRAHDLLGPRLLPGPS